MRRVRTAENLRFTQRVAVTTPRMRIVPSAVPLEESADHTRLRFAREVIERLDGGVLRYSQRLQLHKSARRLGLSLFDANIIIAQIQHQAGVAEEKEEDRLSTPVRSPGSLLVNTVAVVMLQTTILAAVWMMFI